MSNDKYDDLLKRAFMFKTPAGDGFIYTPAFYGYPCMIARIGSMAVCDTWPLDDIKERLQSGIWQPVLTKSYKSNGAHTKNFSDGQGNHWSRQRWNRNF